MPIKPNIGTKSDYAIRPSVPANQKESSNEFNLLVQAVRSNYERLILNWTTDIIVNTVLEVGQFVLFTDNAIYRIDTAYNVGNPITWNSGNATILFSSAFKGAYASEAALIAAHPTSSPGDYALVDVGAADAMLYIWDDTDSTWVPSSVTTVVPAWDSTTPGIVERSTQGEAEAIATQVAAGAVGSLSDARTPSEIGLYHLLVSMLTKIVKVVTITNGASGSINLDCQSIYAQVKFLLNTTVTGNITFTKSNDGVVDTYHIVVPITGTAIQIQFPSDTRMATYMETASGLGWNQTSKILTVSSHGGTGYYHEFSLTKRDDGNFILRYDGPVRA